MKSLKARFKRLLTGKNASVLVFLAAALVLVMPHAAHAQFMDSILGSAKDFATIVISLIGNIIMVCCAWILWFAGQVLENTMYYSVVKMGSFINEVDPAKGIGGTIVLVWQFFRDLANMCFIFVLLYAGIKMILNIDTNFQTVLRNVIIAGLLINFSMFFTKIPIDISNIFSIQIFNAITGFKAAGVSTSPIYSGLSGEFMNALRIQTFYSPGSNPIGSATAAAGNSIDAKFFVTVIMTSVTMLIASAVFIAISGMFIIRFFKLIYLMMISPFYFLGKILPKFGANSLGGYWEKELLKQCIFAPTFFIMMFVAVLFLRSPGFSNTLSIGLTTTFSDGLAGDGIKLGSLVFSYVLIMMMMVGSLKAAIDAGGVGGTYVATMIDRTGKRLNSFARNLPRSTAVGTYNAAKSSAKFTARSGLRLTAPVVGWTARQVGGKAAKSFGEGKAQKTGWNVPLAGRLPGVNKVVNLANPMIPLNKAAAALGRVAQKVTASETNWFGVPSLVASLQAGAVNIGDNKAFDLRNTFLGKSLGIKGEIKGGFGKLEKERKDEIKKAKTANQKVNKEIDEDEIKKAGFAAISSIDDLGGDDKINKDDKKHAQWGEARESLKRLVKKLSSDDLNKLGKEKLLKIAQYLPANKFKALVDEKNAEFTPEDKVDLINARFSKLTKPAFLASEKDKEKAVQDGLKQLSDEDAKLLTTHLLLDKSGDAGADLQNEKLLKMVVRNLDGGVFDSLKKNDDLGDDDKKRIKEIRTEIFRNTLESIKKLAKTAPDTYTKSPEYTAAFSALKEQMGKLSVGQIIDLGAKEITENQDILKALEPRDIKALKSNADFTKKWSREDIKNLGVEISKHKDYAIYETVFGASGKGGKGGGRDLAEFLGVKDIYDQKKTSREAGKTDKGQGVEKDDRKTGRGGKSNNNPPDVYTAQAEIGGTYQTQSQAGKVKETDAQKKKEDLTDDFSTEGLPDSF